MYDVSLVRDILSQMLEAVKRVERRFKGVSSAEDFRQSDEGVDKLDAICMMLIALGEQSKRLDRISSHSLFEKYDSVDWKGVKGMRDIISHHYFDVDAELVFNTCMRHIPHLRSVIEKMLQDL